VEVMMFVKALQDVSSFSIAKISGPGLGWVMLALKYEPLGPNENF
jgi:hypothetical protein